MDVGELSLTKGASIASTAFGDGPGGSVSIQRDRYYFDLRTKRGYLLYRLTRIRKHSKRIATGTFGPQPSGNITVSARNLVISDKGNIEASTGGDGAAGTISISVENATLSTGAVITSSSGFIFGTGGTRSFSVTGRAEKSISKRTL